MCITPYGNVRKGILYQIGLVITSFFINYLLADGDSRTIKKGPQDRN